MRLVELLHSLDLAHSVLLYRKPTVTLEPFGNWLLVPALEVCQRAEQIVLYSDADGSGMIGAVAVFSPQEIIYLHGLSRGAYQDC